MERALQTLGAVLLLGLLLNLAILMLFSRTGLFVLFAAVGFAIPTAVGVGATLAAVDSLYPGAVVVDGVAGMLWLSALASVASTAAFDLGAEGLLLRGLRRLGLGMDGVRFVEAIVGSFLIAAALSTIALLLPDAGLSAAGAMTAGVVASFARYFVGLYLEDKVLGDSHTFDEENQGPDLSEGVNPTKRESHG